MKIVIKNKNLNLNFIKINRNPNIIRDHLLLKFSNEDRLNVMDAIGEKVKIEIYVDTQIKKSVFLYEILINTEYIYIL